METRPPLFLVTGPSGAGKSTVMTQLLRRRSLGLQRFITTTTRAPRRGERSGRDYWFITPAEFEALLAQDAFFESANVYGHYYGSNKQELARLEAKGQPIIYIIDLQGAQTMKRLLPHATVIFVDAPREQLIQRLKNRHGELTDIERRIQSIDKEQSMHQVGDVVVLNEDGRLKQTVDTIASMIRQRAKRP